MAAESILECCKISIGVSVPKSYLERFLAWFSTIDRYFGDNSYVKWAAVFQFESGKYMSFECDFRAGSLKNVMKTYTTETAEDVPPKDEFMAQVCNIKSSRYYVMKKLDEFDSVATYTNRAPLQTSNERQTGEQDHKFSRERKEAISCEWVVGFLKSFPTIPDDDIMTAVKNLQDQMKTARDSGGTEEAFKNFPEGAPLAGNQTSVTVEREKPVEACSPVTSINCAGPPTSPAGMGATEKQQDVESEGGAENRLGDL